MGTRIISFAWGPCDSEVRKRMIRPQRSPLGQKCSLNVSAAYYGLETRHSNVTKTVARAQLSTAVFQSSAGLGMQSRLEVLLALNPNTGACHMNL